MPASTVHLVIIHHGLWGSPSNTSYLTSTLAKYHGATISPSTPTSSFTPPESISTLSAHAETHPNAQRHDIRMVVLNSGINSGDHTYDGIDWCGERLVKEIYSEVERIESEEKGQVLKLSLIGYSLGGLVIRYAAGLMYADGFFATKQAGEGRADNKLPFKSRPKPHSLSTIATPHLGISATGSTFSKVAKYVGSRSLGRSGRQLYLADSGWVPPKATDNEASSIASSAQSSNTEQQDRASSTSQTKQANKGLCLIEALSDPRFTFLSALRQFSRIDIYANAIADLTVPYRTAAFEPHDPFTTPSHLSLTRHPDHPALLLSYAAKQPEPHRKSLFKRMGETFSPKNLPWILNPQRFPFRFPLNYVGWVCLPVLLPVMLGLVLHKLRSDSRVSNGRVEVLERLWAVENGHLPDEGESAADDVAEMNGNASGSGKAKGKGKANRLDKATRGDLESKRISGLLASVEAEVEETIREVGEDYVAEEPSSSSSSSSNITSGTDPTASKSSDLNTDDSSRYVIKPNTPTHASSPPNAYHVSPSQHPLTLTQLRIASNLNNPSLLPQVKKHLAHFEDVLNAHAVIIVRTTSMETHRKGIPLIKAFVQRFDL
ncbi:uncharacterized protein UTRI_04302_B [Ustilago trichophora]|uniref:DUF676 domain-containing protein n=1 Tax=Ustilago trichophora TaxID=86804 RepID=A0A5C3EDF0_9BASI|nr:uncharacterized protein UTRI_04302_B [Ustilago trichophora]